MKQFFLCLMLFFFTSALKAQELQTLARVDLSKYAGTWYQIARNPLPFENGCVCSRQVLTPTEVEGKIAVYNSCNNLTVDGPLREIRGFAYNNNPGSNSKFTVDFGLPSKGAYWIIGLDPLYRYAIVSDPSRRSLYILSKTPTLSRLLYRQALHRARKHVDTSNLLLTTQKNCRYP